MQDKDNHENRDDEEAVGGVNRRNKISLPQIALFLMLVPVLFGFVNSILPPHLAAISVLITVLSPLVGLIVAIYSLISGSKDNGSLGRRVAIIVCSIPLGFIAFFFIIYVGAATGIISLM